jgi:hypothetical protein
MRAMTPTKTKTAKTASTRTRTVRPAPTQVNCPHCKKPFAAVVDLAQPPRLQGAKCPHCKLFVPERLISSAAAAAAAEGAANVDKTPLTKEERQRRG